MSIVGGIVSAYKFILDGWLATVTPLANGLGVEPFVVQFLSGMLLAASFPLIASRVPRLQDDIRDSLSLSGLVAIFTFFNIFYQKFHGLEIETVWGQLVTDFAGSVVTLLAFTMLYIVLEVDFKKWELVEKIAGKGK